ncbi:MAG: metalloregulator ArsR/SmtB family transcription factor [Chloroflexota bacterium]
MQSPSAEELSLLHANVCQALGDPKRLLILYALEEQPRNVTQLAADLNMPQPTVSRHLQVLRERNLVTAERNGAAVIYALAEPRIITILNLMRQILHDILAQQNDMMNGSPQ